MEENFVLAFLVHIGLILLGTRFYVAYKVPKEYIVTQSILEDTEETLQIV